MLKVCEFRWILTPNAFIALSSGTNHSESDASSIVSLCRYCLDIPVLTALFGTIIKTSVSYCPWCEKAITVSVCVCVCGYPAGAFPLLTMMPMKSDIC